MATLNCHAPRSSYQIAVFIRSQMAAAYTSVSELKEAVCFRDTIGVDSQVAHGELGGRFSSVPYPRSVRSAREALIAGLR